MKSIFKPVLVAALLAGAGFVAVTQVQAAGEPYDMHAGMEHHMGGMGRMDPAKMQARHDKHMAELKAKLKLSAAQESAWTTFTTALKPPALAMVKRPDMAELSKLTTPERIDKMKALHAERMNAMNTEMDKRGDATKAFYATLTPEQKKVFDAQAMPRFGPEGRGEQHGRHHGDEQPPAPKKP